MERDEESLFSFKGIEGKPCNCGGGGDMSEDKIKRTLEQARKNYLALIQHGGDPIDIMLAEEELAGAELEYIAEKIEKELARVLLLLRRRYE